MATGGTALTTGGNLVAAADYSLPTVTFPQGFQYLAVAISTTTDRTLVLASATGQDIHGILQNKPKAGQPVEVIVTGETKAIAGAAITRGDDLMVNASGQVITRTLGTGKTRIGKALESGVQNQVVLVFISQVSVLT